MTGTWLGVLMFGTALGCGLIAGVFFAFSAFVMKALARLPAAQAIAAMQSINIVAVTPLFMTALLEPQRRASCWVSLRGLWVNSPALAIWWAAASAISWVASA